MSVIVITHDGVDITEDIVFAETMFTQQVNGYPGPFRIKIKDPDRTRLFKAGQEVTLDIDGIRFFGGYTITASEVYTFPVDDTVTNLPNRFWILTGMDYNILLQKRVLYDHDTPANMNLRTWAAGSRVDDVVAYILDNYTDLAADGITHDGLVDFGSPNPDQDGVIGTASISIASAMGIVNALLNGVFYIDPDGKDFVFVDTDTADSPYTLTDHPSAAGEYGFREMTITYDGNELVNDQLSWGVGQSKSPVFAREQDASSIAEHGRWQGGELLSNIYKQASIDKRADAIVNGNLQSKRGHKDDKKGWQVTLFQPLFKVGQKVTVRSDVFDLDDVLPVRRLTIKFPTPTKARFDLLLSHELDMPWTIHEFLFPKIGIDRPEPPERPDVDIIEKPDPELPGGFVGPEYEIVTYHISDRDTATSFEFHFYNHWSDEYDGEEHFHVKPENYPTIGGGGNVIHPALLGSYIVADPPGWEGSWPHTSGELRGLRSYGRYLSFELPEGAYYATVRWDRLMAMVGPQDEKIYDASGWPFSVRDAETDYPDQGQNRGAGWPVVFRRGHWGTDTPTLRPTEWGETIESTTAYNRTDRLFPPPGHYSTSYDLWADVNYPPGYFPFEVTFPIGPGEQYLQFWLWWVEPRPFYERIGTLTGQVEIINGVEYPADDPVFVPGNTYTYHPDPAATITVQPLMEADVVESEIGSTPGVGHGAYPDGLNNYPYNVEGLEVTIYSAINPAPTSNRITVCRKAIQLSNDRTIWGAPNPYVAGTTEVFVGGTLQRTGIDYTETGPEVGQFQFDDAPDAGETVSICYVANGSF